MRDRLGLQPGTQVLFTLREGKVEVAPISGDITAWYGALKAEGNATAPEVIREQVRAAIAEEVIRESQGD